MLCTGRLLYTHHVMYTTGAFNIILSLKLLLLLSLLYTDKESLCFETTQPVVVGFPVKTHLAVDMS